MDKGGIQIGHLGHGYSPSDYETKGHTEAGASGRGAQTDRSRGHMQQYIGNWE